MIEVLVYFFGWYQGAVWGNIVASLVWGLPAWALLLWRQTKNHDHAQRSLAELHAKIDAMISSNKKGK